MIDRQLAASQAPRAHNEFSGELSVTIVFTTLRETIAALESAAQLADQLGARVRILVPEVVPFPLDLDTPAANPAFKLKYLQTLSVEDAIEMRIDVLLCRDPVNAVLRSLTPASLVLVGGRKRWWRSQQSRLAKSLTRSGHQVIWVW